MPTAVRTAPAAGVTMLATAVGLMEVTEENRAGYTRSSFRHWNAGDNPTDGCNTRAEVRALFGHGQVGVTVTAVRAGSGRGGVRGGRTGVGVRRRCRGF